MALTQGSDRRKPLSADMFKPKQAPSLAALPSVEKLARKLAEAQSAVLSSISLTPWRVAVDKIEEQSRFVPDEQGQWSRVESAAGSMTFHQGFDRAAISAICECAMGGTGNEAAFDFQDRPLSAIEMEISQSIGSKIISGLTVALSEQFQRPVSLFDGSIAMDDAAANSSMLNLHFIANVFGYTGELRLAMPQAELMAQIEAASDPDELAQASDELKALLQRQIGKAECQLIVSLGDDSMLVEEIAALVPGCLVRLMATTAAPVIVSSGGAPVFAASLARSGEQLAARITEQLG